MDGSDSCGGLCSEGLTNVLETSVFPALEAGGAERMEHTVVRGMGPVLDTRWGCTGHDIDVGSQLTAVVVQGEVVDVVAKGILDFGAAGRELANMVRGRRRQDVHLRETKDDVGGKHSARNGDPVEVVVELEGQDENIGPGDLRDGDGVGDWQWCVEDTLGTGEDVCERADVVHGPSLMDGARHGLLLEDMLHV